MSAFEPVTLEEIDERSALRERVDTKYAVPGEKLSELLPQLVDGYQVLEIDGHRRFDYESVYFDTPDLRCFSDHVDGVRPRFKARTRFYRDTGACFLEIKVKGEDDGTTKRQCPYDPVDHGSLTIEAGHFLEQALGELAETRLPAHLAPSLSTRYGRVTLGGRSGAERATLDLDVRLRTMDDRKVSLRDDYALVETKSEGGEGVLDGALVAAGCRPMSISKYRLGIGLLLADDPESAHQQELRSRFR